jgi:hypothetical protein
MVQEETDVRFFPDLSGITLPDYTIIYLMVKKPRIGHRLSVSLFGKPRKTSRFYPHGEIAYLMSI